MNKNLYDSRVIIEREDEDHSIKTKPRGRSGGRKKEIYSFTMEQVSKVLGLTYNHVMYLKARGIINPKDLKSICEYYKNR